MLRGQLSQHSAQRGGRLAAHARRNRPCLGLGPSCAPHRSLCPAGEAQRGRSNQPGAVLGTPPGPHAPACQQQDLPREGKGREGKGGCGIFLCTEGMGSKYCRCGGQRWVFLWAAMITWALVRAGGISSIPWVFWGRKQAAGCWIPKLADPHGENSLLCLGYGGCSQAKREMKELYAF